MAKKTAARKAGTRKTATKKTGGRKSSGARKAAGTRKTAGKRKAAKRTLIDTGTDKRYVRRNAQGEFKESDDQGRSLTRDRRTKAKTKSKPGQGDRGDR
jgi:hypothetical protein